MTKRKLQHFAELKSFPNAFEHVQKSQYIEDFKLKGKWNKEYFKNDNPIVLELGCGKGEYTLGLAQYFPYKNFIGIDFKGARLWRGSKTALENQMPNVAFVRAKIDNIESLFAKEEVSEIWITFPDPQPQEKRIKKRLTSPNFLDRYKNILKSAGTICLKTDNAPLYEYTLEVIKENGYTLLEHTGDLYGSDTWAATEGLQTIQTYYETKFRQQGFKICYLKFRFA